jgi:hypothetical protein
MLKGHRRHRSTAKGTICAWTNWYLFQTFVFQNVTTLYFELTKTYHRHENNRNYPTSRRIPSPPNHRPHHRRQIEESSLYHLSKVFGKYVPSTAVSDPEWPIELEAQDWSMGLWEVSIHDAVGQPYLEIS